MSRSMKVVMWITGVATVIAGLSFVFIQATSVESSDGASTVRLRRIISRRSGWACCSCRSVSFARLLRWQDGRHWPF